jgi:flagellum-specific peptidoglycan hydrolase FlgJ
MPKPTPLPLEPPEAIKTTVKPYIPSLPTPKTSEVEFRKGFIPQEVIDAAKKSQITWNVPASITIAQFILESDWGTKNLGVYNFFGIKDLSWHPGYVTKRTKEYIHGQWVTVDQNFEDFDSIGDCFDIHGRLLAKSKYYVNVMQAAADADEFARRLTGIYATDPNYGDKLISLMKQRNLYQYNS